MSSFAPRGIVPDETWQAMRDENKRRDAERATVRDAVRSGQAGAVRHYVHNVIAEEHHRNAALCQVAARSRSRQEGKDIAEHAECSAAALAFSFTADMLFALSAHLSGDLTREEALALCAQTLDSASEIVA